MRIHASAPGKLVLLGEYAVLEGAPALALAVNRRAQVRLETIAGDACEILSPTLGLKARLRRAQGEWIGAVPAELAWITVVLAALPQPPPACRITLDTDSFYQEHGGTRSKLGLGSSAALTVALLGALHAATGTATPTLAECIAAHREIQRGQGSGVDIAAAYTGGLIRFRLENGRPQCVTTMLPPGLRWRCVYTGRAASTRNLLAAVDAWRKCEPDAFAALMRELVIIDICGVDSVTRQSGDAFLSCCEDYAECLLRLGTASGADIVSREHRALRKLAHSCGVVWKSCGAGGGDIGIACSLEDARLNEFARRASAAGYAVLTLAADTRGLQINNESNPEV